MNLGLDDRQRALADAVRLQGSIAAPQDCGWAVLDPLDLAGLLADAPGRVLGLVDWCLVFEELGTGARDVATVEQVRTFVDVLCDEDAAGDVAGAREALRAWARTWRAWHESGTRLQAGEPALLGRTADRFHLAGPAAAAVPDAEAAPQVSLDPDRAQALADRDLLVRAAYTIGVARGALEFAQRRAATRAVGGRRLLEQQSTAHRLARAALAVSTARLGVWSAAWWEDTEGPCGHRAPAAAATALTAAVTCAHEAVQVFGAAGTSHTEITRLYQAAYATAQTCGPPSALWRAAADRWPEPGTLPSAGEPAT